MDLLKSRGNSLSWKSEPDQGQSCAINLGFAGVDGEIMAYLNSDDMLLPETLAYVANYFRGHPHVDVLYGHRIFVDHEGLEVGRAVLPPTTAARCYLPSIFRRRRCSGASACRTGSERSTRTFTMR